MGDYDSDGIFHLKRRPIPHRGQVNATIISSLASSMPSVTSGILSTMQNTLFSHRSTFSSIRLDAYFSFSSHSSLARLSHPDKTCWDGEDNYVEDNKNTNSVEHLNQAYKNDQIKDSRGYSVK